jgi:hypothetical protein
VLQYHAQDAVDAEPGVPEAYDRLRSTDRRYGDAATGMEGDFLGSHRAEVVVTVLLY